MKNLETMAVIRQLHLLFAGLGTKEREILLTRNGVLTGIPQTLEEVGKKFGVTRERIRQIEAKCQLRIDYNMSQLKENK